jgi:hypothetical protein
VIAGGLALGLVASRFLKASSSSRYEQRRQGYSAQLPERTYDTPPATSGIRSGTVTTEPAVPRTTPVERDPAFYGER